MHHALQGREVMILGNYQFGTTPRVEDSEVTEDMALEFLALQLVNWTGCCLTQCWPGCLTHCQCRYWFTWHIASGEADSNLAGWTEPWGAMVWSKRSRQGGALEDSKWLDVLMDSAFRGLQGTSCGEAHAGPRYCWNISHYMANKLLHSDNSSWDFFWVMPRDSGSPGYCNG